WRYIVVVPFLWIFGGFLAAKYNVPRLLGALIGLVAFTACAEGYWRLDDRIATAIADNSDCFDRMVKQVAAEYRPELLAHQVEVLLNNELRPDYSMHVAGTDFVVSRVVPGESFAGMSFPPGLLRIRNEYCSDDDPYWRLAREINYNLLLSASDENGKVVLAERIEPNCWQHVPQ